MKFKIGDKVEVFRMSNWSGWMPSMTDMIGGTYTIKCISTNDYNDIKFFYRFEEDPYVYWFPEDCIRLIKQEENKMSKFKVGDRVKVIRKVHQENGWDNGWVCDMDDLIGTHQTIESINKTGIYFNTRDSYYGFPPSSLELVHKEISGTKADNIVLDNKFNIDRGIKYQYFNTDKLSLTIATTIRRNKSGDAIVDWAVAFKHPRDQFSKQMARESISTKETKRLFVESGYTRNLIVAKILGDLLYKEENLSKEYKLFVLELLRDITYNVYWDLQ